MHMPVNTAVRAVVRSRGKAAPLGVLSFFLMRSFFWLRYLRCL